MNASPVRLPLVAIPQEDLDLILRRLAYLENKINSSDTTERYFKSTEVRRMLGNVSKQTITTMIQKDVLHPKQFIDGGDYYFPKEEVLALMPKAA